MPDSPCETPETPAVNGNIITKKVKHTIPANTPNLADVLIEQLNSDAKDLIKNLPSIDKIEIHRSHELSEAAKTTEPFKKIFHGSICYKDDKQMIMKVGQIYIQGNLRPLWAYLASHQSGIPYTRYITTDNSGGFTQTQIHIVQETAIVDPELSFATGSELSSLIKYYFFRAGILVPYDMQLKMDRYQNGLVRAAELYRKKKILGELGSHQGRSTTSNTNPASRETMPPSQDQNNLEEMPISGVQSEVLIPAATVEMAGKLSVLLTEKEKELINGLPFDPLDFTTLMRNSIMDKRKHAFLGVYDENDHVIALSIGKNRKSPTQGDVYAVLDVRPDFSGSVSFTLPAVVYLTPNDENETLHRISHWNFEKYVILEKKFEAFSTLSVLCATLRYYFFRRGTPIPYDLLVKRSTYITDLVKGANLYADKIEKSSDVVKGEHDESHAPQDRPQAQSESSSIDSHQSRGGTLESYDIEVGAQSPQAVAGTYIRSAAPSAQPFPAIPGPTSSLNEFANFMEQSCADIEAQKKKNAALLTRKEKAKHEKQLLEERMRLLEEEKQKVEEELQEASKEMEILEAEGENYPQAIEDTKTRIDEALHHADPSICRIFNIGYGYGGGNEGQDGEEPPRKRRRM
ncbi:hypothetical protein DM02DRAFT_652938 [Periconia macrospinosa]|uniref:Uncharacterized protein n=1 Tax=Periconia macrospinosa TaxID=97972 RepID=A0A2V1DYL0_9PLEO|nr:hypothetical protein DM02DRAFT_652938 [Periconia macrospinosa]